jgi:hypothetical protein
MSMVQVETYAFGTIENPLSNGGVFTIVADVAFTGSLKVIAGNLCETVTAAAVGATLYSGSVPAPGNTWPADQYAELTLTTFATSGDLAYMLVRQGTAASGTRYAARLDLTAQTWALYAWVAGSLNTLVAPAAQASVQGDLFRLSVTGNVLSLSRNGSVVQSFTDTNNYIASGSPGFGLYATTAIAGIQTSLWAAGANQAATPTFSPVAGSYTGTQNVTVTSASGGTIYYTTDGSTPTHASNSISSGGTVSVSASETLKAIASVANFVDSAVGSAAYTITPVAATPTFSPNGGTFNNVASLVITITSATPGATIYYTKDGTVPTHGSSSISNGGTISITASATVKALAAIAGSADSTVASAIFTLTQSPGVFLSGTITSIAGASQAGTVTATLGYFGSNPPIITGSSALVPITVSTVAASNGTWALNLWGQDQITPVGTIYTIAITPAGSYQAIWIAEYVMTSGTYDLSTLTPATSLPAMFIPAGPRGLTGAAGPAGPSGGLVSIVTESANFAAATGALYLVTTAASTINATLPTAVGITGQLACIKKVDAGAGTVSVLTTSAQTIDGLSSYQLTNQFQYVEVISDGSNWQIISNN